MSAPVNLPPGIYQSCVHTYADGSTCYLLVQVRAHRADDPPMGEFELALASFAGMSETNLAVVRPDEQGTVYMIPRTPRPEGITARGGQA